MKKFKNLAIAIVSATFVTVGLYSCSNEEVNNSELQNMQNENIQSKPATTSDDGYLYAVDFYGEDISLGKSINLVDPDTSESVTITEVFVGSDTRARGYIANKLGTATFLYFIDVNRSADVLITYNAIIDKRETISDLLELPDYINSDKFDVIEYYNNNTAFGGIWSNIDHCPAYGSTSQMLVITDGYGTGNNQCFRNDCYTIRYRFGFRLPNKALPLIEADCNTGNPFINI